jgi:Fe2+ transport system protein FeoA
MNSATTIPLTSLEPGRRGRLVRIEGGHQVVHRLSELGLTPGVEIEVLRRNGGGPLLLAVRDTRLAIGRGMADKVLVEIVAE